MAVILFPVFGRARENARRTACARNLKQLGTAFQLYTQDYDETLPPASYNLPGKTALTPWMYIVDAYVKGGYPDDASQSGSVRGVFVCPSYTATSYASPTFTPAHSYLANRNIMPSLIADAQTAWGAQPVVKLNVIQESAKIVHLAEATSISRIFSDGYDSDLASHPQLTGSITSVVKQTQATYVHARTRHFCVANYLILDGHVKWIKGPGTNFTDICPTWADITPEKATSGIVYLRTEFPNGAGWFREN